MLPIAKILKSNGIDGGILIGLRDIDLDDINMKEPVFIFFDGLPVPFFFADLARKGSAKAIAHLNDITSLADAEEVVGREIFVSGEAEQTDDEDFIGWKILDKGVEVGTVTGVEPIPGNLCLYVGDEMIPLHEDFILSVDEGARVLDLDLPEGLL